MKERLKAKKSELKANKGELAAKTAEYEAKMVNYEKKREKLNNKRDRLKRKLADLTQASGTETAKAYERGVVDFESTLVNSVTNDHLTTWGKERHQFHVYLEERRHGLLRKF